MTFQLVAPPWSPLAAQELAERGQCSAVSASRRETPGIVLVLSSLRY